MDYWVGVSEPPKCLADVIEAYVAAIFVDSEFDFNVVLSFFNMHLKPFFENMTLLTYENFASNHPTTRLSRLLSTNFGCSEWRMAALETETCIPGKSKAIAAMVMIHNKVVFHSLGQSGRYARVLVRLRWRHWMGCRHMSFEASMAVTVWMKVRVRVWSRRRRRGR